MFTVERVDNHTLTMTLSGKLDKHQMIRALDDLETQSLGIENGKMLYDIVEFHMPSLAAIAIEFSRLPRMFKLIGQFSRAAVLTDKSWLQTMSEWEGKLMPGLEIKAFERHQREAAELWLNS